MSQNINARLLQRALDCAAQAATCADYQKRRLLEDEAHRLCKLAHRRQVNWVEESRPTIEWLAEAFGLGSEDDPRRDT